MRSMLRDRKRKWDTGQEEEVGGRREREGEEGEGEGEEGGKRRGGWKKRGRRGG